MDDAKPPRPDVVERNAEEILEEFYYAETAIARLLEQTESTFTLEVWYEGDLRKSPRPYTYNDDDGFVQLAAIKEHVGENTVKMILKLVKPEVVEHDPDAALPISLLTDRYDLRATDHERVWTKNGPLDEHAVAQARRIADELPVRVMVSKTDVMEDPIDWGYMAAYNLVTVAYESTLPSDRTTEMIEEMRGTIEKTRARSLG